MTPGQSISHYRIIEKLGGGMGVVYRAEDLKLSRERVAALKNMRVNLWFAVAPDNSLMTRAPSAHARSMPSIGKRHKLQDRRTNKVIW